MEKFFTTKVNVVLISILCTILWGSAFPFIKIGYEKLMIAPADIFSKVYFAGLRFFIASILVFLAAKFIFKIKIQINKEQIKPLITLGILQTSLQYFFFYIGLANTTGIKSAIIQSSSTFFTVIAAHLLYSDDRLDTKKTFSLILGLSGILLINLGKKFDLNFKLIGEGFLLFSALANTFASILVKSVSKKINPFILTGGQMFAGSTLLLLVGKIGMKGQNLIFDGISFSILIYLAFVSAAAFVLWYTLLKYNKLGEISIYRLFIPVFGSTLSALFLKGEHFTLKLVGGLILVVIGMFVLNIEDKNQVYKKRED